MGAIEIMVDAQYEIEKKMETADDESADAVRSLCLKVCAKRGLSIKAFDFIVSWAIGKYC